MKQISLSVYNSKYDCIPCYSSQLGISSQPSARRARKSPFTSSFKRPTMETRPIAVSRGALGQDRHSTCVARGGARTNDGAGDSFYAILELATPDLRQAHESLSQPAGEKLHAASCGELSAKRRFQAVAPAFAAENATVSTSSYYFLSVIRPTWDDYRMSKTWSRLPGASWFPSLQASSSSDRAANQVLYSLSCTLVSANKRKQPRSVWHRPSPGSGDVIPASCAWRMPIFAHCVPPSTTFLSPL